MKAEFLEQMRRQLNEAYPAFERALKEPAALGLRINPLRPSAISAARPFMEDPIPWEPCGWYLKEGTKPGSSEAHGLGAFYLQEASAMASAAVLDAKPGERILDLCAAPGGKSTQIGCAMQGEGLLVSNEPVLARARVLAENLERMGIANSIAVCARPEQLCLQWPDLFDAVLVDAPCSGEGMFQRDPAAAEEWSPLAPEGCARRQEAILSAAARMVRPGGRLVYSTCTFNRLENEETIERFLHAHPDFQPEDFALSGVGSSSEGMLRLWPHCVRGDGHFVAKLRRQAKAFSGQERSNRSRRRKDRVLKPTDSQSIADVLQALEDGICRLPECVQNSVPVFFGEHLHLVPRETPSMDGIRIVKVGLDVVRVGRSHIQPLPALAKICGKEGKPWQASPIRSRQISAQEYERILRGERLKLSSENPGWTLFWRNDLPVTFEKTQV